VTDGTTFGAFFGCTHDHRSDTEQVGRGRLPGNYFLCVQSLRPKLMATTLRTAGWNPNAYGACLVAAYVICEERRWDGLRCFKWPMLLDPRLTLWLGISSLFAFRLDCARAGAAAALRAADKGAIRVVLAMMWRRPVCFLLMGNRFCPVFQRWPADPKQVHGRVRPDSDASSRALPVIRFFGGGICSFRVGEGRSRHSALCFLPMSELWASRALDFFSWGGFFVGLLFAYRCTGQRAALVAWSVCSPTRPFRRAGDGIAAFISGTGGLS